VHELIDIALALLGTIMVLWAVLSAVVTFVVPRGTPVRLTRWVFTVAAALFRGIALRSTNYATRDRIMALYAPFGLVSLPIAWLILVFWGFALILFAAGSHPFYRSLMLSASSIFTLGSVAAPNLATEAIITIEAGLGLGLVAILISYLPSIYSSYSKRESKVTGLEAFAGTPPAAETLLLRLARIGRLEELPEYWMGWAGWFGEIEETHTSIPALVFFRSPQPDRSWITAAGAILDSASLIAATSARGTQPEAQLCVRAGFLSLRRIADYFSLDYDPDPAPDDPISVTRDEFDAVYDALILESADVVVDREEAWLAFKGWRVNYDTVLLELCSLTIAPPAQWSSDRAPDPVAIQRYGKKRSR
jgi:hypothetical protein